MKCGLPCGVDLHCYGTIVDLRRFDTDIRQPKASFGLVWSKMDRHEEMMSQCHKDSCYRVSQPASPPGSKPHVIRTKYKGLRIMGHGVHLSKYIYIRIISFSITCCLARPQTFEVQWEGVHVLIKDCTI